MSTNEPDLAFEFIYEKKVIRQAPATDAQIAAVEARFGPLPADYKRFLQSINGGAPAAKHAPAPDPADPDADDPRQCVIAHPRYPFYVECVYGLGAGDGGYDIEYYSRGFVRDVLDREVVAIAGNGFGDQLVFLAPGDPGVYQFVHDDAAARSVLMA